MQTALLLIAFQNNYFKKKGSHSVKGARKSAKTAAKLLAYFRENKLPIVHVLQMGKLEDLSGEKLQPYELLEPQQDEATLVTPELNVFADEKLHQKLQSLEVSHLLIAGLTAEKQILASVQAARELAYTITVMQDACAANTLKFEGEKIKASLVLKVIMAALAGTSVEISTAKGYLKAEQKKLDKLRRQAARNEAHPEETAEPVLRSVSAKEVKKSSKKAASKKAGTADKPSKRREEAYTNASEELSTEVAS